MRYEKKTYMNDYFYDLAANMVSDLRTYKRKSEIYKQTEPFIIRELPSTKKYGHYNKHFGSPAPSTER